MEPFATTYSNQVPPSFFTDQCACGHRRFVHRDTVDYGHGGCYRCRCPKFTWTEPR